MNNRTKWMAQQHIDSLKDAMEFWRNRDPKLYVEAKSAYTEALEKTVNKLCGENPTSPTTHPNP